MSDRAHERDRTAVRNVVEAVDVSPVLDRIELARARVGRERVRVEGLADRFHCGIGEVEGPQSAVADGVGSAIRGDGDRIDPREGGELAVLPEEFGNGRARTGRDVDRRERPVHLAVERDLHVVGLARGRVVGGLVGARVEVLVSCAIANRRRNRGSRRDRHQLPIVVDVDESVTTDRVHRVARIDVTPRRHGGGGTGESERERASGGEGSGQNLHGGASPIRAVWLAGQRSPYREISKCLQHKTPKARLAFNARRAFVKRCVRRRGDDAAPAARRPRGRAQRHRRPAGQPRRSRHR